MTKGPNIHMRKIALGTVLIICVLAFNVYCQETQTLEGSVVATDTSADTITVSGANTRTFNVGDARIVRDIYDISLMDINPGDYVKIEYHKDSSGSLEATKITLEYHK